MLNVECFPVPGLQFHFHAQRLKPPFEVAIMLFRQNFRRRHQRGVEPAFQGHQRRGGRHHGFAGADVALQQPPHRVRTAHVSADFAKHLRLRAGELEAELRQKRFHQTVIAAAGQGVRFGLEIFPAKLHCGLQGDELVQRQPPPRDFHVGQFFGKMNHADGVGARRKVRSSGFNRFPAA